MTVEKAEEKPKLFGIENSNRDDESHCMSLRHPLANSVENKNYNQSHERQRLLTSTLSVLDLQIGSHNSHSEAMILTINLESANVLSVW